MLFGSIAFQQNTSPLARLERGFASEEQSSKRDERRGRSRHRPTEVLEFGKINLATLKVATIFQFE